MLTPENIEERLSLITGSDASIICGQNPYCTPYKLWEYKTRRAESEDISNKPSVIAGNRLESAVIDWLADELGLDVIKSSGLLVKHKDFPWMAGNIDGMCRDGKAIVEVKTTGDSKDWGESGTDSIPNRHKLQIAHYLAISGAETCYVAVLIRGVDFRHYVIKRDLELEEWLIKKEYDFYLHVRNDLPVPITDLNDLYKWSSQQTARDSIKSNWEIDAIIERYRYVESTIDIATDDLKALKLKICEYMGIAEKMYNVDGRLVATWSNRKGPTGIDRDKLESSYPEVYAQVVKVGAASRAFKVKSNDD